jgi:hypothetical protein
MLTSAYFYEKRSISQLRTNMEIDHAAASNIEKPN